jgi:hypothetical protein
MSHILKRNIIITCFRIVFFCPQLQTATEESDISKTWVLAISYPHFFVVIIVLVRRYCAIYVNAFIVMNSDVHSSCMHPLRS